MMTSNLGLVDTNVLIYAVYPAVPQHASSRALIDRARQPGASLCVVPQNLAEFYATVTNPRRVTQAKSTTEALDAIDDLLALPGLTLLAVPPDIVTRLTQLLRQHPVQAQETYDAQLVATMLGNGVTTIYTHNTIDFQGFPGIQVL